MIKKLSILFFIFLNLIAQASTKLQLEALEDFNSAAPSEYFSAKITQENSLDDINLQKNDILYCSLNKTIEPKRAKMDAKIYFNLLSYETGNEKFNLPNEYIGKYKKEILKEKIKNASPKKIIKTTAGTVGNHYIPGVSQAISFVDGIVVNEEENRLKSGFVQVYKDSPLSYVEKGQEVEIKKGDIFYLIIK